MTLWQGARHIAQHELKRGWGGMLLTMLFVIYLTVILSPLIDNVLSDPEADFPIWMIDFMYFTLMPNFGYLMNRTIFSYWRDDSFTKKLAYWRSLPIPFSHMTAGRLLMMLCMTLISWILFFGVQYAMIHDLREQVSLLLYFYGSLFWLGYSIIMGTVFIYWEQGFGGKVFFIMCWVSFLLYGLITYAVHSFTPSLVAAMLESSKEGFGPLPLLAILLAVIVLWVGQITITRKIARRSLLS